MVLTPTFSKIVLLFYSIATNMIFELCKMHVLLFRVKTKKLQLFYYLGYLQQPRFEMCKGSIGDIEPLHSQCLSYFVVTYEIRKGCIGAGTIAFISFAIRCCAEIIPKESLSF